MKLLKAVKQILTTPTFWLGLILIFALWIRTYRIDRPIADWHSWRQADTAAISRNFVKEGFTIFAPKFDDLSPLAENDLPNPEGYRYVEFPLYNILVGLVWLIFPFQEAVARFVSIFLSLGSTVLLFFITRRYSNTSVALIAAAVFAFLPYNIFYSTVILPEPLLVFSMLSTLLFYDLWFDRRNDTLKNLIFGILAILSGALALLTKPTAVFLIFPILYISYHNLGFSFLKSVKFWLFLIFTTLPFGVWRAIALSHPEGIPRFKWLLNGSNIRFKGAFFYWIFQDRLSRLILGGSGFSLLILGLLYRLKSEHLFFFSWIFGMILYVIVFATGNVTHDYYQVPLIPILAIFVAKGIYYLFTKQGTVVERIFYILLVVFLVGLMSGLRWREARTLFNVNNPKIVEVGRLADQVLPQDAKVIAPYGGDTAFLYQTNRKGWPSVYLPLGEMIKNGATHYVTVSLDSQAKDLVGEYRTIIATSQFAIIDLTQKNSKVINNTP